MWCNRPQIASDFVRVTNFGEFATISGLIVNSCRSDRIEPTRVQQSTLVLVGGPRNTGAIPVQYRRKKAFFSRLDAYTKWCKTLYDAVPPFAGFASLIASRGDYGGHRAIEFWQLVTKGAHGSGLEYLRNLLPVAAMLLASPAGESQDEFVFSTTGRVFTDDRNSLSPVRLEQITVITMFIKNFKWSQHKLNQWVKQALQQHEK